jgi:hypothetical protein
MSGCECAYVYVCKKRKFNSNLCNIGVVEILNINKIPRNSKEECKQQILYYDIRVRRIAQ